MVFGILSLNIITGVSLAATPTDKAKKKNEETSILFIKRIFMFIARFFSAITIFSRANIPFFGTQDHSNNLFFQKKFFSALDEKKRNFAIYKKPSVIYY
jgi:hypothetical protein